MYFLANVSFICDLFQALKSFCSIYKHFVEYFIYVEMSGRRTFMQTHEHCMSFWGNVNFLLYPFIATKLHRSINTENVLQFSLEFSTASTAV
jgi:hypothetical protein